MILPGDGHEILEEVDKWEEYKGLVSTTVTVSVHSVLVVEVWLY